MVSPTPLSQPVPTRSPVTDEVANLRHPMPDLQSLQGAYVGNIERLEEHAERMSEGGSDLGEEIRKLHTQLKQSDSRRSSLRSIQTFDELTRQRSRGLSASSHANSIVDLNGNARWGGYSPGGYNITSPVGSVRSNSWTNPSNSFQRQRSESKTSRLGQIVHPEEVVEDAGRFEQHSRSPRSLQSAPLATHSSRSPPAVEQRKVSSFTKIYDEIANDLPEDLRNNVIMAGTPERSGPTQGDHEHDHNQYQQYASHHDYPDRPPTAASTDTTHQARTLWQDFDGTHAPETVIEEEPESPHSRQSRNHRRQSSNLSFQMRPNSEMPPMGAPPPDDNMVFYPAPVPKMLNLPKRLSQLPASNVQARRRTQLLESMQQENRKSAAMVGDMADLPPANNRKSRQSLMGLPPQLRASAYFDQAPQSQEFAVKGDSAEQTLESILDASARAPVSAFTDHPFSGSSGKEIYAPEQKRRKSHLPEVPSTLAQTRRRSSFNVLDTKNNSNGEPLNKLKKRNSSADMNLLIVKASESRMSLGDELDERDEDARGPHNQHDNATKRDSFENEHRNPDDIYDDDEHSSADEEEKEPEEEELQFGAPTTLLAELQIRQAKQKTRTVNYATLVEQGMINSRKTLLEMDDVAEKEKQRRIKKKVNLAWEAHAEEDEDSEDDVPLGILYKPGGGPLRRETSQPTFGLIAQRELEDNEPLSRRRNRLRGLDPNKPRGASPNKQAQQYESPSQLNLAVPTTGNPDPDDGDVEGETLLERKQRLKEKQALSAALGEDVRKSTVSGDFASEMLSKLGVSQNEDTPTAATDTAPAADEEETLGQRRARLQAEAAARGDSAPASRPPLRSTSSLADILSQNPINNTHEARKVSNEMLVSHLPQGSLLQQNEVAAERKKQQRLTQNMRASSYGAMHVDPLLGDVGAEKHDDDQPLGLKIQAYKKAMAASPSAVILQQQREQQQQQQQQQQSMLGMHSMGMMSTPNLMGHANPQMMGMGAMQPFPQQQQSMMGVGGMQMNTMNMGMGMGGVPMNSMNLGMGVSNMQMPMGMQMSMGMNGMPMMIGPNGMPMMMSPMDPRQRDQIDRWMQGIRH
ncbi:hypothetical protein IAQ61_009950 [Plenodomus lingam]|uniref:uncharacterized protein n=1 Tax=Leptosphaeria maculans TaxID=5022 RepID=UPI00333235B7|nr:hypothetical protein IAQ61_009950 [Plenodomus lingam]